MDSLKNAVGMGENKQNQSGGGSWGIGDKLSSAVGGGKDSEKGEGFLEDGHLAVD